MCEDNKSPYKIWNTPTRCLLSLYVFFVSHNPFEMVTRSHPGPDPAQNQQLNCFAAHLSALSSIRAFTSRDGVSNDLSCNSSIFDHSRLLMLLRWLRFMLNLNDCLRKKEEIKKSLPPPTLPPQPSHWSLTPVVTWDTTLIWIQFSMAMPALFLQTIHICLVWCNR